MSCEDSGSRCEPAPKIPRHKFGTYDIRCARQIPQHFDRLRPRGGDVNYATPAAQQRFHATKHAALIVDHENDRAAQRP